MSPFTTPAAIAPGNRYARTARRPVPTSRTTRHARGTPRRTETVLPEDLGLGQLFLHTRDAIVVANIDTGCIVLWNPAAHELFGYTPDEALGQSIDLIIPPAVARVHYEALAHHRRTDDDTLLRLQRPMEVPALHRSGQEIRAEMSWVLLDERPAPARYVMALLRDARDRNRAVLRTIEAARAESARAEAESALHEHNQLLSSGLIQLSEPLARLYRSTDRLVRAASESHPGRVSTLARVVEARAQRVHRRMRHLADTTAMQTATMQLQVERTNLVPLVSRAVAAARERSKAHKLNIALPQGLTASVDATRFVQVIEALIDQAMRRNPRGCWIDVDLRRPLVGLARLEVRDYGRPVSDAEQQELLATSGPDQGLAVTRWIVEQHGGTLSLESPSEGGLRVVVTLPTQRRRVLP